MTMVTRKELLKVSQKKYLKSTKKEKSKILDQLVDNTGLDRNYLTRKLQPAVSYAPRQRKSRKVIYDNDFTFFLVKIWRAFDYPCSQNLADYMAEGLAVLIRSNHLCPSEEMKRKLLKASSATIERKLKKFKRSKRLKINSGTKPGSLLKQQIPIRGSSWQENKIGSCELDTVHHCGNSVEGMYALTVNLTDITTQWTEEEAVWGKGELGVIKALDNIKSRLPFKLIAIDPDNGSEFINWDMYKYTVKEKISFTRGRPYYKNDNAHIEQKNWTHVRKIFGLRRFDKKKCVDRLNDLYRHELRLYKNFFIANKKLISKKYQGVKVIKKYDQAKTSYQRVLENPTVLKEQKDKLTAIYLRLDPIKLKENIVRKVFNINN